MIVCINLNAIGERYIAYISYNENLMRNERTQRADELKNLYDEVYIIDLDTSHEDFIAYIVLHGCRV